MPPTLKTPPFQPRHRWGLLLTTGYMFFMAVNAWAMDLWVVTDGQHPIKAPPGARVIELDAPDRIKTELAANLPADRTQATAIVQQRLNDGGAALQIRLAAAYQGVTDAWSLGITKVPAVVVDGRYVVYGDPDVDRAVSRVLHYRGKQP